MRTVTHGMTVASTYRTTTPLLGPLATLAMAVAAAMIINPLNSSIQAMQLPNIQFGLRSTAGAIADAQALLILPTQDTQALLAHRVLKCVLISYFPIVMVKQHWLDIPWRAIPKYQHVILSSFSSSFFWAFSHLFSFVRFAFFTFRRSREKSMRRQTLKDTT
jgi:hypothetical protein